ncbi:MAG: hypothetical protein FWD46_04365 [Cystobacterineae bacterium]|nr:hypothetical protein [Cystobacterineae bacterium]
MSSVNGIPGGSNVSKMKMLDSLKKPQGVLDSKASKISPDRLKRESANLGGWSPQQIEGRSNHLEGIKERFRKSRFTKEDVQNLLKKIPGERIPLEELKSKSHSMREMKDMFTAELTPLNVCAPVQMDAAARLDSPAAAMPVLAAAMPNTPYVDGSGASLIAVLHQIPGPGEPPQRSRYPQGVDGDIQFQNASIEYQQKIEAVNRTQLMISNLLKAIHETQKAIIQNFRV